MADIDREQKGRPYRNDPLFAYLLDRGYGTTAYKGRGLVAGLDGWVAKLTGFDTARQHFAMLNAWPARVAAPCRAARRSTSWPARRTIEEIEQNAIDNAGGATVRMALTDAQARIEAIDVRLLTIQDERDTITVQQTSLGPEVGDAAFDTQGHRRAGQRAWQSRSAVADRHGAAKVTRH